MAILLNRDSRIIVQGITGKEGAFHAAQCLDYGSNVVGGVTPGKGGRTALGGKVPVFNSCREAVAETNADVSAIFVPAPFAADAIVEAASAGITLIVCITEGIPLNDMKRVHSALHGSDSRLIGPNCPGIITPGQAKAGILPASVARKGNVGVISKSGTLTYEVMHQLVEAGLGQSTCVGIGGDAIIGTDMIALLELFERDEETKAVVIIGEIGGTMEIDTANFIKKRGYRKPLVGFVAGETAPPGRRMGHAGAIVGGSNESASAKKAVMRESGIRVVESPADIGRTAKTFETKNRSNPG